MKKYIITIFLISCAICLNACTVKKNDNVDVVQKSNSDKLQNDNKQLDHNQPLKLNDKSVSLLNEVKFPDKNVRKEMAISTSDACYAYSLDLDNLSDLATQIIKGTIVKISYDAIDGDAWTKLDVKVTDSLKGNLTSGNTISIYYWGGYITLKEYSKFYNDQKKFETSNDKPDNTVLKFNMDGKKSHILNEVSLFYLKETPSYSPLPKGAYERIGGKYAELKFDNNENLYKRDNPNGNNGSMEKFTLDDVKAKICKD